MATIKKSAPKKITKKRRHVRFPSDMGTQAFVLTGADGEKLKVALPALVMEESFKGCSLVVLQNPIFHEGARFTVKVGKLDPLPAEVRWVKSHQGKIMSLGLVFLK